MLQTATTVTCQRLDESAVSRQDPGPAHKISRTGGGHIMNFVLKTQPPSEETEKTLGLVLMGNAPDKAALGLGRFNMNHKFLGCMIQLNIYTRMKKLQSLERSE